MFHQRGSGFIFACLACATALVLSFLSAEIGNGSALAKDAVTTVAKELPAGTGPKPSDLAAPYLQRAAQLENRNRLAEALNEYNAAIKTNPNDWSSYYRRAGLYLQMHDPDKALVDLDRAKKFKPHSTNPYVRSAIVYEDMMEDDMVIENITVAISIDPKLAWLRKIRAQAYGNLGKYDLAIADMEHYMANVSDHGGSDALRDLGRLFLHVGQPIKAVDQFNKALAIAPSCKKVREPRGDAYLQLKNYKAAIADYAIALRQEPSPALYKKRAQAYKLLGQDGLAAQDEKTARTMSNEAFEGAPFMLNKAGH